MIANVAEKLPGIRYMFNRLEMGLRNTDANSRM